jgi:hypothetical protein
MGTSTIPVTTGTTRTLQTEYISNLRGRLKAVSATVGNDTVHDGKIYCEIGTMLGGRTRVHRDQVLASGYIGSTSAVSWTGDIPIVDTEEVYIYLWASVAASVNLRVKTED